MEGEWHRCRRSAGTPRVVAPPPNFSVFPAFRCILTAPAVWARVGRTMAALIPDEMCRSRGPAGFPTWCVWGRPADFRRAFLFAGRFALARGVFPTFTAPAVDRAAVGVDIRRNTTIASRAPRPSAPRFSPFPPGNGPPSAPARGTMSKSAIHRAGSAASLATTRRRPTSAPRGFGRIFSAPASTPKPPTPFPWFVARPACG